MLGSSPALDREALRLLEEHEQIRARQLAEFHNELGRRLASLDRGERVDPGQRVGEHAPGASVR